MAATASEPCSICQGFLFSTKKIEMSDDSENANALCPICLGLFGAQLKARLKKALFQACEPYVGEGAVKFSWRQDAPFVAVPGDIIARYQVASQLPMYKTKTTQTEMFTKHVKRYATDQLTECIKELEQKRNHNDKASSYPDFVEKEEQGHLAVQVMLAASKEISRPSLSIQPQKRQRKKQYETQGGHPRSNLERKIELQGTPIWSVAQAEKWISQPRRQNEAASNDWFLLDATAIRSITLENALEIHVAVWRRPFLVQGNYTKTRRDVSQSPFFINGNNPDKRQRLGRTSVEELILTPLVQASGGISSINNSLDDDNVVFGKAKFHASGREDMDVRMILPPASANATVTGRPFCVEVVDALRMPTVGQLEAVAQVINNNLGGESELLPESSHYYGRSPLGVGVDSLTFAKGHVFKNLQGETEHKHKFYGCLCWSEKTLPAYNALMQQLTACTDGGEHNTEDHNCDAAATSRFPLVIQQRTPIRVLHRRANAVRVRHILSCHRVERLDDHFFRIHISTDAGTYVKEFCHGDLGRTQPNLGALLGGKTDILELDCEGIQIN